MGNFRGYPRGHSEGNDAMAFFNGALAYLYYGCLVVWCAVVCKYPPSLAYSCITLGTDLLLLALLATWKSGTVFQRPLLAFGRTPLCFYIIHFFVIELFGLLIRHAINKSGIELPWVIVVWLCLLLIMFPICEKYGQFKRSQSEFSLWRFL